MSGWRLSRAAVPAMPAAPAEPVSVEAKRWSAELGMWVPETGEMNDNSIVGYMWQPGNYD